MVTAPAVINTQSWWVLPRDGQQNPWNLKNSLMPWLSPDQTSQWGEVSAENASRCCRYPALSEHYQDPGPFCHSFRNWKRAWWSYLPIVSVSYWQSQGYGVQVSWLSGCGIFLPFLLPCEILQKEKKKAQIDNQSACAAQLLKHTLLAPSGLKGLERWVMAILVKQAFSRAQ